MKILQLTLIGVLSIFLWSCSKNTVKPEDTEIDGDLAGAFELVDEEYAIEGEGESQYIDVKIHRTNVTVPYTTKAVAALGKSVDDDEVMVQAGFGYTLYDANGKEIEEVEASDNEEFKDVKSVLSLENGDEGTLRIKLGDAKDVASIKLTTKAKILSSGPLEFVGAIGKYGVKNFEADFNFAKGEEKGKYQYTTSPAGAFLYFKGTNESYDLTSKTHTWKITMTETNENGSWCGSYEGTITLCRDNEKTPYYYKMEGKFTNFKFDTYSFTISSKGITK
ncbi:MAG: hypothetical protein NC201_05925 [Prevotella sp.]|nr:hypothetical protein [Bacteroides sp.]MCM1366772.1 hypothetical protein [Prevotella sp.]MCM1437391.1 hypothetical protein [Prevotella sp.]